MTMNRVSSCIVVEFCLC